MSKSESAKGRGYRPDKASSSSPRAALRSLLSNELLLDSDLDAFCLDYFPDVKARFSGGMDRGSKLNLLLETTAVDQIIARLRDRHRDAQSQIDTQPAASTTIASLAQAYDTQPYRTMSSQLAALYLEREVLTGLARDTREAESSILDLRRRMRQGPQLQAGEFLIDGRYRLQARIGRGGFATVWLAHDRMRGGRVAIKVLHGEFTHDSLLIERFYRGARRMADLRHPNVVQVIELPREENGFHFFVMEHLSSGDLQHVVLSKCVDRLTAVRAVLQAGEALQHAHEVGLIHRDVKPANILLDADYVAHLGDFDLVFADDTTGGTRTGPLGTFLYAPPEELENAKQIDVRADVYSLGMTLAFVMYEQRLPPQALTDQSRFLTKLPCTPRLKEVIRRAISLEREQRHTSAREFCCEVLNAFHEDGELPETKVITNSLPAFGSATLAQLHRTVTNQSGTRLVAAFATMLGLTLATWIGGHMLTSLQRTTSVKSVPNLATPPSSIPLDHGAVSGHEQRLPSASTTERFPSTRSALANAIPLAGDVASRPSRSPDLSVRRGTVRTKSPLGTSSIERAVGTRALNIAVAVQELRPDLGVPLNQEPMGKPKEQKHAFSEEAEAVH